MSFAGSPFYPPYLPGQVSCEHVMEVGKVWANNGLAGYLVTLHIIWKQTKTVYFGSISNNLYTHYILFLSIYFLISFKNQWTLTQQNIWVNINKQKLTVNKSVSLYCQMLGGNNIWSSIKNTLNNIVGRRNNVKDEKIK